MINKDMLEEKLSSLKERLLELEGCVYECDYGYDDDDSSYWKGFYEGDLKACEGKIELIEELLKCFD